MFTATSRNRLLRVHADLQRLMNEAEKTSPIPFQIAQGLRTIAEQRELYAQGRTKPGKIVTWKMQSKHLTGDAVDVAIIIGGKYIVNPVQYDLLAKHILATAARLGIAVTWGGEWKRKDRPHYERKG